MYYETLARTVIGWGDECECSQCGAPLDAGAEVLFDEADGFTFCGPGCAAGFAVDRDDARAAGR
jgi:hypothetical protein